MFVRRYRLLKTITKCIATPATKDLQNYRSIPNVFMHTYDAINIQASQNQDVIKNIKRQLKHQNKQYSNVNLKILAPVIKNFENQNFKEAASLGLRLLCCCGDVLYKEPVTIRQELANHVWNIMKNKNTELTINHYHALLQTYIDNDYCIDPNEFLKNMTVKPNYTTYCLLLQVLPSSDDCKLPETIITNLGKLDYQCDEKIYNELVYAYAIRGCTDKAKNVIKLMEEQNLEPSSETYTRLMYAFAKINDNNALIEGLLNYTLSTSNVMKIIKILSLSGNTQCIRNVLSSLKPLHPNDNIDVVSLIVQLVHAGRFVDAHEVVAHIPLQYQAEQAKIYILSLLEGMIKTETELQNVVEIINNLAANRGTSSIWEEAIITIIENDNEALALKIFKDITEKGIPIDDEYLFSYVSKKLKSGEMTNYYSVLKYMTVLEIEMSYHCFRNYIIPYEDTTDSISMAQRFVDEGISARWIINPLVRYLIVTNKLKDALMVCDHLKKKVDCQMLMNDLMDYYEHSKDIDSCIQFLFKYTYNGTGFAWKFVKMLLQNTRHSDQLENDVIKFLKEMRINEASMSFNEAKLLQHRITSLDFKQKECALNLVTYFTGGDNYNTKTHVHPQFMNVEQLYSHLDELRTGGMNCRGVLRKLLILFCNLDDKRVDEIKQEIDARNYKWTSGMKATLLDYYVRNQMVEKALSIYYEFQEEYPNFKIDNFKIIRFATLLVEYNKLDKALDVISNSKVNTKTSAIVAIHNLLKSLITKDPSDYTERIIKSLINNNYCKTQAFMVKYLIFLYMSRGQVQLAMNTFHDCVELFGRIPVKYEFLVKIMELPLDEHPNKWKYVQDIYNQIVELQGEDKAAVNIVMAYATCNMTTKLKNTLKTHAQTITPDRLCKQISKVDNESLLTIVSRILENIEDTTQINLAPVCSLALERCRKENNYRQFSELKKLMKKKKIDIDNAVK